MRNPFAARREPAEERAFTEADLHDMMIGIVQSSSGASVTRDSALTSVAVLACLQVRAETFSSLPGGVFQKDGETRVGRSDHPVARLLFDRPNDLMTSKEFWRWKSIRTDTDGNSHARVIWKNGYPDSAWPLYRARPTPIIDRGRLVYRYSGDDLTPADDYPADEILHWKGSILKTPLEGASLIDLCRDAIGLSMDSERFFARFLNNGSHFPGYLETDHTLKKEDINALQEQLKGFSGVLNAGTLRIFDRGLKYQQNPMNIKDADLTLQQRWNLEQACRIFRVPLPLVQDWTHGTYTNNEQGGLWFAQHTIAPICIDTEAVCRKLFLRGEEDLYIKFNVDGLLRGDFAARMSGYATAIAAGFMTRAQPRKLEDWDPITGLEKPLIPLNMGVIDADGNIEPTANSTAGAPSVTPPSPRSLSDAFAPLVADAVACIRTRAAQDRERGRDSEATLDFGRRKLAPIAASHQFAGLDFDVDAVLGDALATMDQKEIAQ